MERYVVSAQRSGLNWLRYCIEHFYGVRTPGQRSILGEDEHPEAVFVRSHDALNVTSRSRKSDGGAWTRIDPAATAGDRVLLLLRDPLETFVRMAEKRYPRFLSYVGNLRFHARAAGAKRIAYYEDLVADPIAMTEAMAFLQIQPQGGREAPDANAVAAEWEALGRASRSNYDAKQTGTGGARTRDRPTDFTFHQAALSPAEAADVWRFLQIRLTAEEMAPLERYRPATGLPPVRPLDRVRLLLR